MKKNRMLAPILIAALAISSCGSDDDNNDKSPQREEDTTGSNGTTGTSGTTGTTGTSGTSGTTGTSGTSGTTGTSGTSGTTGSPTASCMSNSQRENIRKFLNCISDLRSFQGSGKEIIREEDMEDVNDISGSFDFSQSGENSWIGDAGYCEVGPETNCQDAQTVYTFKNGCFNVNGVKAKIIKTSDSSLTYSILENGTSREKLSIASGKLTVDQSVRRDGQTVYILDFNED